MNNEQTVQPQENKILDRFNKHDSVQSNLIFYIVVVVVIIIITIIIVVAVVAMQKQWKNNERVQGPKNLPQ